MLDAKCGLVHIAMNLISIRRVNERSNATASAIVRWGKYWVGWSQGWVDLILGHCHWSKTPQELSS